jgi:hypothetical protein
MMPPTDIDKVVQTFRLGWTLAELRGRYRPGLIPVREPPGGMRTDHALPLADERSIDEQLIELHGVLNKLAGEIGVDGDVNLPGMSQQTTYSVWFDQLGSQLRARPTHEVWELLTEVAYRWDAYIQDKLVITAPSAAAYQLGRGLAETYWALDPTIEDPDDWRSWYFLLGERRCRTLGRLATRLVEYVDPLTVPAITSSLNAWAAVAADPDRRKPPATIAALYDQGLLWRDLFRGERRPEDLAAKKPIKQFGLVLPVLRAFYVQIILGLIAAGLLAFSGAELAAGSATKTNTFIAVLSGLGITSAGAYARAKGMATSLVDHLKTAFERDRVGVAATLAPPPARSLTAPLRSRGQLQIDSASPRISAPVAGVKPTPIRTPVAH